MFYGVRLDLGIMPRLWLRTEGRLLEKAVAGMRRWDVAPSIVLRPGGGLEIATGYRSGNLRDPDFAAFSGSGWFAVFGLHVTEQTLSSAVEFWRARFGGQ